MNKVIVTNNKNNVNGSNALAPQKVPSRYSESNKQRELEKQRNEHIKRNKERLVKSKARILKNIMLCFVIGIILVHRYSVIYNKEKNIIDIKNQITMMNRENENLKIDLLKYNNIKNIESKASKELNMISKNGESVMYIDLEKNNFKNTSTEETEKSEGIVKRLKDIFY